MPELMVDVITSLDGYAAAEGWPGLWGMGGPDYYAWLGEDPGDVGEVALRALLGALVGLAHVPDRGGDVDRHQHSAEGDQRAPERDAGELTSEERQ